MAAPSSTYRDLSLTCKAHPGTNDVLKTVDVDAVKASILYLLFAGPFDSPFDPNFGANLRGLLFENFGPTSIAITKRKIVLILNEYEPRCSIDDLYIGSSQSDSYGLDIGILFHVVGNPLQQVLNYTLSRAR